MQTFVKNKNMQAKLLSAGITLKPFQLKKQFSLKPITFLKVGRLLFLVISIFFTAMAIKTNSPLVKELLFSQGIFLLILIMLNFKYK